MTLVALLMITPLLLGTEPPHFFSDHLPGRIVILVAGGAMAEAARPVRWLNVASGTWAAPFMLEGAINVGTAGDVAAGLLLTGLSLPRGRFSQGHYSRWDRLNNGGGFENSTV